MFVAGSKIKIEKKLFFQKHLYVTTEEPCFQQKSPFNHPKCHLEDRAVFPQKKCPFFLLVSCVSNALLKAFDHFLEALDVDVT